MASFTSLEWQQPPEPLFSMSLSSLTKYAALAKQSWYEYKTQHHQSTSTSNHPRKLIVGETWLSDSIQVQTISEVNKGVYATSHLSLGTVLVRSRGVIRSNALGNADAQLDFYDELLGIIANQDNFAKSLLERIQQLCPSSNTECDAIAAADPLLGDAEFQGNLFAILDKKGARNDVVTNAWIIRTAVKMDRNNFFEGLFPLAAKFNHSCHPNCFSYFEESTQTMVIRTTSYVSAGSELNIFYLAERNMYMPTDQRRRLLEKKYGFVCQCSRCDPCMTAECAGVSKLTLLKRQRFERLLEAMKCPQCSTINSNNNNNEDNDVDNIDSMRPGALIVPVDDHRILPEGQEPLPGWHVCASCGLTPSVDLDTLLVTCYQRVQTVARLSSELPSNLDLNQVEQILNLIQETNTVLDEALHIGHWLSCRLHDVAFELTRTISVRCRRYAALNSLYYRAVSMCAFHARVAIMAWLPVIPSTSHIAGQLYQRAADAITAEAEAVVTDAEEFSEMKEEALERGRQAHQILSGVCGVY